MIQYLSQQCKCKLKIPSTHLYPLVGGDLDEALPRGLERHPEEVEDGPDEDGLLLAVPHVHEAERQEGGEQLHQRPGPPHDERQVEIPEIRIINIKL